MFSQKQYFSSRLPKPNPLLTFVDVYDSQSFIREYVLDNIFVCIFAYMLFYLTLWYANKVIKQIEESNDEMLETVAENRTKLADLIALKNKRREYEEVVMKAKGAQRVTAKHLENEIEKLNNDLSITTDKLMELEKILRKINFSELRGRSIESVKSSISIRKVNERKIREAFLRTRSRTSKYLRHRSRRVLHHHVNTVSLSLDRLRDTVHQSDSSNGASAETSSNASSRGTHKSRHMLKIMSSRIPFSKKIPMRSFGSFKFTKSMLDLPPIFHSTRTSVV